MKITGSTEDLELDSETSEECKEKCSSMIGECGSWSFDSSEGICYIHTVDSCCGQFGKREDVSGKEFSTTFCLTFTLEGPYRFRIFKNKLLKYLELTAIFLSHPQVIPYPI